MISKTTNGFSTWLESSIGSAEWDVARIIAEKMRDYSKSHGGIFDVTQDEDKVYIETKRGSNIMAHVTPSKINIYMKGAITVLFDYDVKPGASSSRTAEDFSRDLMSYISTVFMVAEIQPPFVDLSIKNPLTQEQLEYVDGMFSVIDPKEYQASGSINVVLMKRPHDSHDNISDRLIGQEIGYSTGQLLNLPKMKNPRVAYFKGPEGGYLYYNMREMRRALLKIDFNGRKPHEEDNYRVVWGSGHDEGDLVYEQTNNICDYVYHVMRGKDGNLFNVTVYTVPSFPAGFESIFQEKLQNFISEYKFNGIDFNHDIDMPSLMKRFWNSNIDEQFFIGGFIYHRDGVWGAFYDVAGHGRGNLLQHGDVRELYFTYTFIPPVANKDGSGFLRLLTDSNNARTQGPTWQPGWTDIVWRFYPNQEHESISRMIRDYTHSY